MKNPLLELQLKNEKLNLEESKNKIFENLYSLFNLILEDPVENIIFESISIIIGYLQLIIFIFDKSVSKDIIKNSILYNLVFDSVEKRNVNK